MAAARRVCAAQAHRVCLCVCVHLCVFVWGVRSQLTYIENLFSHASKMVSAARFVHDLNIFLAPFSTRDIKR